MHTNVHAKTNNANCNNPYELTRSLMGSFTFFNNISWLRAIGNYTPPPQHNSQFYIHSRCKCDTSLAFNNKPILTNWEVYTYYTSMAHATKTINIFFLYNGSKSVAFYEDWWYLHNTLLFFRSLKKFCIVFNEPICSSCWNSIRATHVVSKCSIHDWIIYV